MKPGISIFKELIEHAMHFGSTWRRRKDKGLPGETISNLPEEKRKELKQLTSDDINHKILNAEVNPHYFCEKYYEDKHYHEQDSNLKMEFDKRMRHD